MTSHDQHPASWCSTNRVWVHVQRHQWHHCIRCRQGDRSNWSYGMV